jgi:hypothetical protein
MDAKIQIIFSDNISNAGICATDQGVKRNAQGFFFYKKRFPLNILVCSAFNIFFF